MGNVVYAEDMGGTINYKYASNGNVKQIIAPGSTTNITYDDHGRQKTLVDPDAGTMTYNYNAYNELISQTDNKGKNFQMFYDQLGRIDHKVWPNGTSQTKYEYNTSGNGIGQLKKITGTDNYYESYAYDQYGRTISRSNVIESGKTLTTNYEYNKYGELTKTTYPSGFAVKKTYNNLHYLTEIRRADNNNLIWKSGAMDPCYRTIASCGILNAYKDRSTASSPFGMKK